MEIVPDEGKLIYATNVFYSKFEIFVIFLYEQFSHKGKLKHQFFDDVNIDVNGNQDF